MSVAAEEDPWRVQVVGDTVAAQRRALVVASYPVLLLLVILAAFVRYLWIALTMYGALMLLLSYVSRGFSTGPAAGQCSLGGLSAAAIATVAPAFSYDAADGEGEPECAVCLEAVRGGEKSRRLPACAHTFHIGCIDMWLDSHATCPVCRRHVLLQKAGKQPLQTHVRQLAEEPLPPV